MTGHRFSIFAFAFLAAACNRTDSSSPSATAAPATAAPSTSAAPAASAAPSASSAGTRADALTICQQMLAAKVGTACDHMPPIEGADAAQLTIKTTGHTWYAGAFVFSSPAAYDAGVAKMKAEGGGSAKRKPPTFLTNAAARTFVAVDGEVDAKDVTTLRRVVTDLH